MRWIFAAAFFFRLLPLEVTPNQKFPCDPFTVSSFSFGRINLVMKKMYLHTSLMFSELQVSFCTEDSHRKSSGMKNILLNDTFKETNCKKRKSCLINVIWVWMSLLHYTAISYFHEFYNRIIIYYEMIWIHMLEDALISHLYFYPNGTFQTFNNQKTDQHLQH